MELFEEGSSSIWKEILTALNSMIFVLDSRGKILFASETVESATGFAPAALKGKSFCDLLTPDDLSCYFPNLLYLAGKGKPFEGEIMLVRQNGTRFVAFMSVKPHLEPKTGEQLIIVCIHDAERLGDSPDKGFARDHYGDLVKIADGIAHEIRNPLVGIGGFVTRLYKGCPENEASRSYFDLVMTDLRKIENLIHKVEYFAKLPKPLLRELKLKPLVESVAEEYGEQAARRGIDIVLDLNDISMMADSGLLRRVLSIFVENAMDAMPKGGRITVRLDYDREGGGLIQVSDNGKGIAAEDLPYIFNPFFSTKPDGAGIDLAVVKRIAESHGGCVRVESSEGAGASFFLKIPIERRRAVRIQRFEDEDKDKSAGV